MKNIRQQGLSFIEILISLFILMIVLLGIDGMGLTTLYETKNSWIFNTAINQLHNINERLQLIKNKTELSEQVKMWNQQNKMVLPHGKGVVTGVFPDLVVTIYWGNHSGKKSCMKNQIEASGCLQEIISIPTQESV